MAWFADLSDCTYFQVHDQKLLRAVGWLERGKPYNRGAVDPAISNKVTQLLSGEIWEPGHFWGHHQCDLCSTEGPHGVNNLFIPADRFLYVSPELIRHYIVEHHYSPPAEWCAAVLTCPPMMSAAYLTSVEQIWERVRTPGQTIQQIINALHGG